jgi:hypothetical protein
MSPFGRIESVSARDYAEEHSEQKRAHQTYGAVHRHQFHAAFLHHVSGRALSRKRRRARNVARSAGHPTIWPQTPHQPYMISQLPDNGLSPI